MINENITFMLFEYTSDTLSPGSHKKILCICNECGKERLIEYRKYRDLCHACKHATTETRNKISKNHANVSGKNNPSFGKHPSEETRNKISKGNMGKHRSEETKIKISESKSGENHPMYGKHHSEETKLKISKAHMGKHHNEETKLKMSKANSGENNSQWKGGKKLSRAKSDTQRRKLFGFISHNKPQENFHGHHLDFNHVIFIPKVLHRSIYHSVVNNINMDLINDIACDWYLTDQII